MAATRLIALHKNKGMTVAACLNNRTDYIENPDKTEQGQYVSSYACSALTADEEFMLATVYKGNIIKNLIMDLQSYTNYLPNETTGGIFVSWRRKE